MGFGYSATLITNRCIKSCIQPNNFLRQTFLVEWDSFVWFTGVEDLDWPVHIWTPLNTFRVNWNAEYRPDHPTSVLEWIPCIHDPTSSGKSYSNKGSPNMLWFPFYFICDMFHNLASFHHCFPGHVTRTEVRDSKQEYSWWPWDPTTSFVQLW